MTGTRAKPDLVLASGYVTSFDASSRNSSGKVRDLGLADYVALQQFSRGSDGTGFALLVHSFPLRPRDAAGIVTVFRLPTFRIILRNAARANATRGPGRCWSGCRL